MLNATIKAEDGLKEEPGSNWITGFTYLLLIISVAVCCMIQYMLRKTKTHLPSTNNENFFRFQKKYYVVYFLALFGDWLQGPYIYKLYSHYGFTNFQIAVLYVVGFSASVFFGTGTGVLADYFGRKRMCMVFCLTYSLCCFLKIFPNYNILLLGRLLGGISTSLLFSVFESWYVYEHVQVYDFPKEWIAITFSKATFGNGLLAIAAGMVANLSADVFNFGPASPFILAIPCLMLSCLVMSQTWNENYGKRQKGSTNVCIEGLQVIFRNKLILMLGFVQSLFESVMYVFVFLWTPILDPQHPPLGIVFSVFMVCIMIGSSLYQLSIYHKYEPLTMLIIAVQLAMLSQLGCAFATHQTPANVFASYFSFILIEISVGMYFPAIGYIKSEFIPESHRANIMNWFRVPLNIITCIILLSLHGETNSSGNSVIFLYCSVMLTICYLILFRIKAVFNTMTAVSEQIC